MDNNQLEFTRMVKKYQSVIYSVCLMYGNDAEETNDLMQEALIRLWKGFDSFRGESEMKTWVWRVTMNSCINQDQKKKRRRETHDIDLGNMLQVEAEEDSKQLKILYDRIHRLQPFDRALVLLWLDGTPYEDIGNIIGISTKNVSVKLMRIKEQLKKMK